MMRTSRTGTFNTSDSSAPGSHVSGTAGFTLIEILAAICIISITVALIMPSFRTSDSGILRSEARHLSSTLRYIHNEAVGRKQTYAFLVDLDTKTWGYQSERESRHFDMHEDVMIKDVFVPSVGETDRGELTVVFGPMGSEEPVTIHLQKGDTHYTVIFNHLSGRTKILEGYVL